LGEANQEISKELESLNHKFMKGPELSRRQLFEREDLLEERYSHAHWKRAKVGPDYHIEFEGHLYSVPFTLSGEHVELRCSTGRVEISQGGTRVASHPRAIRRRGATTLASHMPEHHRQHAEWTQERMVRWASSIGPGASALAEERLARRVHPELGYRSLLGILRLEKQFGPERLEAACNTALSKGAFSYKSVKSMLDKKLESACEPRELKPSPRHENGRGNLFFAEETCAN
jgi:hypothetical protein